MIRTTIALSLVPFFFAFLCSCAKQSGFSLLKDDSDSRVPSLVPDEQLPPIEAPPKPPPNGENPGYFFPPLSWESTKNPERKQWSEITLKVVEQYFQDLDQAQDATRFCARYPRLSREERINFWGQLISAMSYYESGWSPTTRFKESGLGIDPITGNTVYSEGLLQLSYQDQRWAPWCEFRWDLDRHLSPTDPRKTIFDPRINLSCGIGILARQIRRTGQIVLTHGVYWAVLREGGRFQKINEIAALVQRAGYCQ